MQVKHLLGAELMQVKLLSDAPLFGRLLALPTNIRLDWKSLPGTNTPVFYENSQISDKKVLYHLAQGPML
jgi:hypothetical protein